MTRGILRRKSGAASQEDLSKNAPRIKHAHERDRLAVNTGFFQSFADDSFGGRLTHFERAARHRPQAVVGALDQEDASLVVNDGGVACGYRCRF